MVKIYFQQTNKKTGKVFEGQSSKSYDSVALALQDLEEFEFEDDNFKQEILEIKEPVELEQNKNGYVVHVPIEGGKYSRLRPIFASSAAKAIEIAYSNAGESVKLDLSRRPLCKPLMSLPDGLSRQWAPFTAPPAAMPFRR